MYGECWFTGKFYFKHGGSQNATLRHGRLGRYFKDSCVLMYFEGVEMTSDDCASVLHKVKSWLLEAAEPDRNKTHNKNNGDI